MQPQFGGIGDGVIVRYDPAGQIVYSTYFGGTGFDSLRDVYTGPQGNLYITGEVHSAGLPTSPGAFQTTPSLGYAMIYDPVNQAVLRGTYFPVRTQCVAADSAGDMYIAGFESGGVPTTPGSYQPAHSGSTSSHWEDAFVVKLDANLSTVVYGTYFGGFSVDEEFVDIDVDAAGKAYVTGRVVGANEYAIAGKLSADGSSFDYRIYPVGSDSRGYAVLVEGPNQVLVSGRTRNFVSFTTGGAVQTSYAGNRDGFILRIDDTPGLVPAQFSNYGAGCGPSRVQTLPSTFYEQFGNFDLANSALRFTPNGAGSWNVTTCAGCFDPGFVNGLNLGDDQLSVNHALGFAFPLSGGGSTTSIDINSNGWIGLISGQHTNTASYFETVPKFLNQPARIALMWDDLDPSTAGDVYFDTMPGQALVTWSGVPEFGTGGSNTMQLQLFSSGEFVLAYGAATIGDCLVGYSRGGGVPDPGPRDLSNPSGTPALHLDSDWPPRMGTTINLGLSNVPATAPFAGVALGFTQTSVSLAYLGMPDCYQLTNVVVALPAGIAGTTATSSFVVPGNPMFLGVRLYAQGFAFDAAANPFGLLTSDGAELVLGM